MQQTRFKVYGYRWVVLLTYMLVTAINQLLWITFAPITSIAASHYAVSDLAIGLLSMSFMVIFIIVSIPASWVIDTFGIRAAVGTGVILTGVFGLLRGVVAPRYPLVLAAQIGIAVGQPFILNAITTVAARWFPLKERATASGLGTLAMYLGIFLGLALTPYLTIHSGMDGMLRLYGIAAFGAIFVFFLLARDHPPTAPCSPEQEERTLALPGLKQVLHKKQFVLLMVIFFIGLGAFNGVTTWIENIVKPRGFSITQAGIIGGVMIAGGLVGALIIPLLSDKYRKRIPFIFLALTGAMAGLAGLTYATGYGLLLASAFTMGFFLLSAGPVGFQYGAEIAYPAPEGTSNGLLILTGQISGIIFIFSMDSFKSPATGSMTPSMTALIGLFLLSMVICTRLKESVLLTKESKG